MSDLFRKQAIDEKQSRWIGEVSAIRPVRVWVPVLFLTCIALVMVMFLFFGSYLRKERVTGVVVAAEGVIRIRSPEAAVISAVPVRDGQEVRSGELLAELTRERFSAAWACRANRFSARTASSRPRPRPRLPAYATA